MTQWHSLSGWAVNVRTPLTVPRFDPSPQTTDSQTICSRTRWCCHAVFAQSDATAGHISFSDRRIGPTASQIQQGQPPLGPHSFDPAVETQIPGEDRGANRIRRNE